MPLGRDESAVRPNDPPNENKFSLRPVWTGTWPSCDVSTRCSFDPDGGSWSCRTTTTLKRPNEHPSECPIDAQRSSPSGSTHPGRRETPQAAAAACGVSERTARRWLARYRAEGEAGLRDRSSRPRHSPRCTPQAVVDRVLALRADNVGRVAASPKPSPYRPPPSAASCVAPDSTVSLISNPLPPFAATSTPPPASCCRSISRSSAASGALATALPATRPDALAPSAGSSSTSPSNDHSRIAFSQILPDERILSAVEFLLAAVAYYSSLGVPIRRLLTDPTHRSVHSSNACTTKNGSTRHWAICLQLSSSSRRGENNEVASRQPA